VDLAGVSHPAEILDLGSRSLVSSSILRALHMSIEVTHYKHWWRAQGLSELTLKTYTYFVERYLRETGHEIHEVTREQLEEHLAKRRPLVKPSSLSTEVRAYKSFWAWWAEEEDVENLPSGSSSRRCPRAKS
jgi:hypothetical protein